MNQEADKPKYSEDDLLPVRALADLVFCERRAALHHIEAIWADNVFTVEGTFMHQRVHSEEQVESRGELRIARGLRLRSLRLGLSGIADVVEFHRVPEVAQGLPSGPFAPLRAGSAALTPDALEFRPVPEREAAIVGQGTGLPGGVSLPGARGLWQPLPVEYKRGRLRREEGYEVQLCAQALCLEEMLNVRVPLGAVFYGQPRKRLEVVFGEDLRRQTETAAARLHELIQARKTPPARYEEKCESCSLLSLCMPKTTGGRKSVDRYLAGMLEYDGLPPPSEGSPPRNGAD